MACDPSEPKRKASRPIGKRPAGRWGDVAASPPWHQNGTSLRGYLDTAAGILVAGGSRSGDSGLVMSLLTCLTMPCLGVLNPSPAYSCVNSKLPSNVFWAIGLFCLSANR